MHFALKLCCRLLVIVLLLAVSTSFAGPTTVTVMTKNMDAGTDFGFFFSNLQTNPALGAQLTLEEFQKNNFPLRASLLAQESRRHSLWLWGCRRSLF